MLSLQGMQAHLRRPYRGSKKELEIFFPVAVWNSNTILVFSFIRSYLKKRILVQDRGGREVRTGEILLYVEDLNRSSNKEIGPKDFFEMASIFSPRNRCPYLLRF